MNVEEKDLPNAPKFKLKRKLPMLSSVWYKDAKSICDQSTWATERSSTTRGWHFEDSWILEDESPKLHWSENDRGPIKLLRNWKRCLMWYMLLILWELSYFPIRWKMLLEHGFINGRGVELRLHHLWVGHYLKRFSWGDSPPWIERGKGTRIYYTYTEFFKCSWIWVESSPNYLVMIQKWLRKWRVEWVCLLLVWVDSQPKRAGQRCW